MKPLSQNAIGRALGLSSAMMVKMRKNGCPMDSVEAVANWRRRNILPTMQSMLKKGWKDEPVSMRPLVMVDLGELEELGELEMLPDL